MLRFVQPRALGRKVSDEFTVPLCRTHHRELHRGSQEETWWRKAGIDPLAAARALWLQTHPLREQKPPLHTIRRRPMQAARRQVMTSLKQIEANRRNAARSTGPTSEDGKQRSRYNAVRHGLTAETVIPFLENAEDYKAFELSVTADFEARTAVERELVLRLAGLLWRPRVMNCSRSGN